MTVLTYSREDIDLVTRWLTARENEKNAARNYHGDRPCLPAAAMLAVCRNICRPRATFKLADLRTRKHCTPTRPKTNP